MSYDALKLNDEIFLKVVFITCVLKINFTLEKTKKRLQKSIVFRIVNAVLA